MAQGLIPLLLPISHKGRHSGGTVLTKSLGVTIDDKLCWNCHIEKLTKKIACGIGDMKRVSNLIPQATLHLIYQALAQSHFDCGSTVGGACGKIAE